MAVRISMITAALVMLFTVLELLFPGRQLIPGWLYTEHKLELVMKDVRMGGPFKDYELNAEFFEMNVPFLGAIPIDIEMRKAGDEGRPFIIRRGKESASWTAVDKVMEALIREVEG